MNRDSTNQSYHKKRKRGKRCLLDKRKNEERRKQQHATKENLHVYPAILPATSIPSTLQANHLCHPHLTPLHRQPLDIHQQICNPLMQVPILPQQSSSCLTIPLPANALHIVPSSSPSTCSSSCASLPLITTTSSLPVSKSYLCTMPPPSSRTANIAPAIRLSDPPHASPPCTIASSLPPDPTLSTIPSTQLSGTVNLRCTVPPSSPASLPHSDPQSPLLSESVSCTTPSSSPSLPCTSLPSSNCLLHADLPVHWQLYIDDDETQYCKIESTEKGVRRVTASVIFHSHNSWKVFVWDKRVVPSCEALAAFPEHLPSDRHLELVHAVDKAALCPGNPEERFVSICKKKGGTVRGDRGHGDIVAYIDDTTVIDSLGNSFCCSVRRTDCDIICKRSGGDFPVRCKHCSTFRNSLRSTLSREQRDAKDKTSASSHTCYCNLTSAEKEERLKNLHRSLLSANNRNSALQAKIAARIQTQSILLPEKDVTDITSIIHDVESVVEERFPSDSPQRIFWDQQLQYNSLKNKKQMRWHPYMIKFALNLKYLSTSAYKATRLSGVIHLPSERTLSDYTHWLTPHSGVQLEFIEEFKRLLVDVPCGQHHCALSMDEMKIKSGLIFDKHNGTLVGFTDLGSVNRDIEIVMGGKEEEEVMGKLADHVFVFLARSIFKPSLSIPVAHYFSLKLRGDQIFPLAWEVIEGLELYNLPVVALTSDGAKPNRRFYRMCQQKKGYRTVPHKSINPYGSNFDLFFFSDVPHLLKTARNCFSNSFSHSKSRKMQKNGQDISWKSIEHLFLLESKTTTPGVRMCHKLTRDHVWLTSFTRMRVYLAAQVMSQSVASALEITCRERTRETRIFIRNIDKFFDCLNVKSPILGRLKRNSNISPYSSSSDERLKWLKEDFLGYLQEWQDEGQRLPGSRKEQSKHCLSRETLDGMRITVNSFTELVPKLLRLPGVKYILSEVFSQDPLERYFSRQRHRGGHNDNPTAYQVPYSASTLVQQKSVYRDLKTMNVEPEKQDMALLNEPLKKRKRRN